MMKALVRGMLAVAAFGLLLNSAAAGGGLLQTLPKDGCWAKYFVELKDKDGNEQATGTLVIASVGRVAENGADCRWVELRYNGEQNGMKQKQVMKLLFKESDLKSSAKGELTPVRGYAQEDGGKANDLADANRVLVRLFTALVAGRPKTTTPVKQSKTIDYQNGKLKIAAGATGTFDFLPDPDNPKSGRQQVKQTVWRHKSIPFGAAAMDLEIGQTVKGKVVPQLRLKFEVQDSSQSGAKSALPEKN